MRSGFTVTLSRALLRTAPARRETFAPLSVGRQLAVVFALRDGEPGTLERVLGCGGSDGSFPRVRATSDEADAPTSRSFEVTNDSERLRRPGARRAWDADIETWRKSHLMRKSRRKVPPYA